MKAIWIFAAVIVAAAILGGCMPKKDYSKYMALENPAISEKPAQKVLFVEAIGDPNKTGSKSISALFGMYFRLKGTVKDMPMPGAPKLRLLSGRTDGPKDEWKLHWALEAPDSVSALPEQKPGQPQMGLETWKYGTVAEILHKGAYSEEPPTIERLKKYITDSGYVITGDHEEEYFKGPGMFLPVDPKDYLTIIRYEVKKAQTLKKSAKK